jgi:ankyrin repeat protein
MSTPLNNATMTLQLDDFKLLVAHGADINLPDHDGDTATILAARCGDLGILEYLWEQRADFLHVSRRGEAALDMAVAYAHLECVVFLMGKLKPIMHGLHQAVQQGNPFAVELVERCLRSSDGLPEEGTRVYRADSAAGSQDDRDATRFFDGSFAQQEEALESPHDGYPPSDGW